MPVLIRMIAIACGIVAIAAIPFIAITLGAKQSSTQELSLRYQEWLARQRGPHMSGALPAVPSVLQRETDVLTDAISMPPDRLVIDELDVDAPIVSMGLSSDGRALDAPDGPDPVAWYDFTADPGLGGNAVLAGHVEWSGGSAVFTRLHELRPGDRIVVVAADSGETSYEVFASDVYGVAQVPMADILAASLEESVILITCAGSFRDGDYTHRLVVWATRVAPAG